MAEEKKTASENYVEQRLQEEVGSKEFMSIDPTDGSFMIPVRKVGGVQQYMRLSVTSLDGTYVPDLDQTFYVRKSDGTFEEVA